MVGITIPVTHHRTYVSCSPCVRPKSQTKLAIKTINKPYILPVNFYQTLCIGRRSIVRKPYVRFDIYPI